MRIRPPQYDRPKREPESFDRCQTTGKRIFITRESANEAMLAEKHAYSCVFCMGWHIGKNGWKGKGKV